MTSTLTRDEWDAKSCAALTAATTASNDARGSGGAPFDQRRAAVEAVIDALIGERPAPEPPLYQEGDGWAVNLFQDVGRWCMNMDFVDTCGLADTDEFAAAVTRANDWRREHGNAANDAAPAVSHDADDRLMTPAEVREEMFPSASAGPRPPCSRTDALKAGLEEFRRGQQNEKPVVEQVNPADVLTIGALQAAFGHHDRVGGHFEDVLPEMARVAFAHDGLGALQALTDGARVAGFRAWGDLPTDTEEREDIRAGLRAAFETDHITVPRPKGEAS